MSMTIANILSESAETTGNSVEALKLEMGFHIERMKHGMNQYYEKLNQRNWNGVDTLCFFKSTIRGENIEHILQYLLLLLAGMPAVRKGDSGLSNLFFQFREFVETEAKLLGEKDVIAAILGEFLRAGLVNDRNLADTEKRIGDKHREISDWVRRADSPTMAGLQTLLRALKEMSLLWFDVRQQDIRRVSRSDIRIYKSVSLLESRWNRNQTSKPGRDLS